MSTTKKRQQVVINLLNPAEITLYGIKVKTDLIDLREKKDVQLYEGTSNSGRTIRVIEKSGFVCEVLRDNIVNIFEGDINIWSKEYKGIIE